MNKFILKAKFWDFIEAYQKRNIEALILLAVGFCSYLMVNTAIVQYATETFPAYAGVVERGEVEPVKEMSDNEFVWKIMTEEYGLTFDEAIKGMSIARCESGHYKYAINKNTDGSIDAGYWQLNEKYQKKNLETWSGREFRDCAFDLACSTRFAMELYKKQSWTPWVCNR